MTDKEQKLPRKLKVGNKWYSVEVAHALRHKAHVGEINYSERRIRLLAKNFPLMQGTFWHELTHAILEDMGEHKLNNNEHFVEEFSNRLYKAIRTAKFV